MKGAILNTGWIGLFVFALTTTLVSSCSGREKDRIDAHATDRAPLTYQMRDTVAEFIAADTSGGYVRIELKFPVFSGVEFAPELNRFVASKLWAQNRTAQRSWLTQIKFFIDQYKQLKEDIGTYGNPWTHMEMVSVRRLDGEILTLEREYTEYSGGAHGRNEIHYYNFAVKTGDTLLLEDIIKPGTNEALSAMIDFHFREQKGLTNEQSLISDGGLNVETIPVTQNFALDTKGIRFYYNPYEIAAYAAGPIIIEVPLADLAPYLKVE